MILTVLAVTPLPFPPGAWWMWLMFGLAGEGLLIWSTLRDEKFYQTVFAELFRQEFDLSKLRSKELQQKVAKALEYRDLVVQEIEREDEPVLDDYLRNVADGLEDWIVQLYHLAKGLDAYRSDPIIARDVQIVPQELAKLQQQLRDEQRSAVRDELARTIKTKQSQWDTLSHLQDTMSRANLQLENTLAAMGTVYMQVRLLGAKDVDSGRVQRLQADMSEQVSALEDVSAAMDEVYAASG
jgi:hypothetical protein